jgi:hypothetical protein
MLRCGDSFVDGELGRSRPSNADRAGDTAVDHGPRVHYEPAKCVRSELICVIHWRSGGPGGPQAMRGGAEIGDGRRTTTLRRKLAEEGVLELRCTIHDVVWTRRNRRMVQSSPGGRGRPWDTGEDVRQR